MKELACKMWSVRRSIGGGGREGNSGRGKIEGEGIRDAVSPAREIPWEFRQSPPPPLPPRLARQIPCIIQHIYRAKNNLDNNCVNLCQKEVFSLIISKLILFLLSVPIIT